MIKQLLAPLLAVAVLSHPAPARQPPAAGAAAQQDEVVRVNIAVVQIDVIVTDRSGRRVKGLTAADFVVQDEGAAQTIDLFRAIEGSRVITPGGGDAAKVAAAGAADAPALASPLLTPYQGRHIALVFDDLTLSSNNFARARSALSEYVRTKLAPGDQVAVISTGGQFAALQQFTNDKQRLLSAINRLAGQQGLLERLREQHFKLSPAEALRIDAGDKRVLDDVVARVLFTGPDSDKTPPEILENRIRVAARDMVSQLGHVMRVNLKTLANLFGGMAALPGRKVVVLMTEAFLVAGGTSEDASAQLNRLIDLARRGGVSVYALDAAGLATNNIEAGDKVSATELKFSTAVVPDSRLGDYEKLSAARALAAGTGGDLISGTNALAAGVDRAVEDSSAYYVVGFRPAALDNKFHRLHVSVKGRPELVVRARRGYLALDRATAPGTDAELAAALVSPVGRIDLPLEVVANVVPSGGEQVIQTGLHVGRNYLTLPDPAAAGQVAAYEVLAWVFAAGRDEPVGIVKRTLTFDLGKDAPARARLKADGLVHVSEFTGLAPGQYQIRAAVRERSTGLVGSAYQFFEVPDARNVKEVSLSSVVLTPAGQAGFGGHNSFRRGAEIDVRYVVYNPPRGQAGLAQRVRLSDARGATLFESELPLAAPAPDQAAAPQGMRIRAPAVRGRYALYVSLRDAKGKLDMERRADLVVD